MSDAAGGQTGRAGLVATALLDWFAVRARDVPWRDEPDPYRVWVCEVMAQQTRMRTVRERLPEFFAAYPSLESLAASKPDELMRAWEGLGYYARARNLRRAAGRLVQAARGVSAQGEATEGEATAARLPSTVNALLELPGVGPYTAGAVASIAFGRPEPAVDGNARRVLSRLLDIENPTATRLDRAARALIAAADRQAVEAATPEPIADTSGRSSRAGDLNQAIMDLGGEICTPRSPRCEVCPVSTWCLARSRGTVAERPPRRNRPPLPHHDIGVTLVWRDDGRLFIQRRPAEGLLGGLWEFPGGKVQQGESPEAAAVRETREETGLEVKLRAPAGRVEHSYSHFRITLHAFHAERTGGRLRDGKQPRAWVSPARLREYAFPAANRRILDGLESG